MNLDRKYKKSLNEQRCLRLETTHPDNDNYDGVITHIKSDFIVLREVRDFEFDGIIIIPKRFIKSVRNGEIEKCCNKILRHNGAIKKLETADWLGSCDTLQEIFNLTRKENIWLGVEIIFNERTNSAFYLGSITNSNDEEFSIKCYDATGNWEKEYQLGYDEVFRIELDSKYCNHFNAYMKFNGGV